MTQSNRPSIQEQGGYQRPSVSTALKATATGSRTKGAGDTASVCGASLNRAIPSATANPKGITAPERANTNGNLAQKATSIDALADLDMAMLTHLYEIAGPALRDALKTQLIVDLEQARKALVVAVRQHDSATVRAQGHVLVSLCGTVGAEDMRRAMDTCNRLAHAAEATGEWQALSQMVSEVGPALTRIISRIENVDPGAMGVQE